MNHLKGYLNLSQLYKLNFKKLGKNVLIDKNVIIPFPHNIEKLETMMVNIYLIQHTMKKILK